MSSLSRRTLCLTSPGRMVLIPHFLPPLPLVPPSPPSLLLTEQLPVAGTVLLTRDLHMHHVNQFVLSPSCTLECQELLKVQLSKKKKKSCPSPLQTSCFRIFEGKPFISIFFYIFPSELDAHGILRVTGFLCCRQTATSTWNRSYTDSWHMLFNLKR